MATVMSIAIGINLGLYAILAADTRTTRYLFGRPFHDDDSVKIQKTTIGLITGAGFAPLLDAVKEKLAVEQVTNIERVLAIIKEESETTMNTWRAHRQIASWLEQTGWIFSYTTLQDGEPLLRVGVFHPSLSKEMNVIYNVGDPAIIMPQELDSETAGSIYHSVLQKIEAPMDVTRLKPSIEHNSTLIGALISVLQPHCSSISKRFQIGIHIGSQTGISDIMDIKDDGTVSLDIHLDGPSPA